MHYRHPEGRWDSLCQRGKNGEDALQGSVGQGGEKWTNDVGKAMCTKGICKADKRPYVRGEKMAKMHYRDLWGRVEKNGRMM